jgi:CubicO group peptidase (beta-lactamase class C family)
MAIMVDKGLLDFEEKVSTYWPEFATNGKSNILVKDVLRHESGLEKLCIPIDLKDTLTENVK